MGFLVTINALVSRKKEVKLIQDVPTTPASPVRNVSQYATLIASATAAQGERAEEVFPRILQQAAHHRSVVTLRAPLSSGVLASWVDEVMSNGSLSISEINRLVGIESSSSALDCLGAVGTVTVRPAASRPMNHRRALPAASERSDASISIEVEVSLASDGSCSMECAAFLEQLNIPISDRSGDELHEGGQDSPATADLDTGSNDDPGSPSSPATTLVDDQPESPLSKPKALLALDDFSVVRHLGQGGFGSVFLVKHAATGTRAALKVIQKKTRTVTAEEGSRADKASTLETAFRWAAVFQEQNAMRRMQGSPGLVDILGSFHDTRNFYIVSPYYAGGDLHARLEKERRFSLDQTCVYGAEILAGLEVLHKRGIIHRDLKPANILIDAEGHLVITDMGLSKVFKREEHKVVSSSDPFSASLIVGPAGSPELTDLHCGTTEYVAPEMWMKKPYSYGVDIWSLGVMIFEMLVGHCPWEVKMLGLYFKDAVINEPFELERWERMEYHIDQNTIRFFQEILEKNPDKRPTIDELKYHHFFRTINWQRLSGRGAGVPWMPKRQFDASDISTGDSPVINSGSPYEPDRDPLPRFSYVSPGLLARSPSHIPSGAPASPDPFVVPPVPPTTPSHEQAVKQPLNSCSLANAEPDACPGDVGVAVSYSSLPPSSTAGSFHTINMSTVSLDVETAGSHSDSLVAHPSESLVTASHSLGVAGPLPGGVSPFELSQSSQANNPIPQCQSDALASDCVSQTAVVSRRAVFSRFKVWAAGVLGKISKTWTRWRA